MSSSSPSNPSNNRKPSLPVAITSTERRSRFYLAHNILESRAAAGDFDAIAKLRFFDRTRDLWPADRKLKFLTCSMGSDIQLSMYSEIQHEPVCQNRRERQRRWIGVSYCQSRWTCDFCYRAHLFGVRQALKSGLAGTEVPTNRPGQIVRWKQQITRQLRSHDFILGRCYFFTWQPVNRLEPIHKPKLTALDNAIRVVKETLRRAGSYTPYLLATRFDAFKNQVRGVYFGADSEVVATLYLLQSKSLKIQKCNMLDLKDLQIPLDNLVEGASKGWSLAVEPAFFWLDKASQKTRDGAAECFMGRLDTALAWLVGNATPWQANVDLCLRLDREFSGMHLFRVNTLAAGWESANPSMDIGLDRHSTSHVRDARMMLGRDGEGEDAGFGIMACEKHKVPLCAECNAREEFTIGV